MRTNTRFARTSALPAIAAVLALSSTPAVSQEAQLAPAEATPTVNVEPEPIPDSAPTATAPTTEMSDSATAEAPAPKSKVLKPAKVVAKASAPVAARTAAVPHVATTAAPAPQVTAPMKPAPIVDTSPAAEPTPVTPAVAAAPVRGGSNETALELGAGALALAALGAGAYAVIRRRRRDEEMVEDAYEPEMTAGGQAVDEPVAAPRHDLIFEPEPPMIAPSAFAWDNPRPASPTEAATDDDGSDRRPNETWVERAHRGPSPANPSVSLRARLKRAAFFDKREREVAAGTAEPIETDAGLPEALVEEQERELA